MCLYFLIIISIYFNYVSFTKYNTYFSVTSLIKIQRLCVRMYMHVCMCTQLKFCKPLLKF